MIGIALVKGGRSGTSRPFGLDLRIGRRESPRAMSGELAPVRMVRHGRPAGSRRRWLARRAGGKESRMVLIRLCAVVLALGSPGFAADGVVLRESARPGD